jgi:tRNA 2-thiouridine synthesizing protein A
MQKDVILDTLGLFCPMPIIKTSQKIKELKVGQVLEVISDDEGIKEDMPAWCETTGHEFLGLEEQANGGNPTQYRAYVKRSK